MGVIPPQQIKEKGTHETLVCVRPCRLNLAGLLLGEGAGPCGLIFEGHDLDTPECCRPWFSAPPCNAQWAGGESVYRPSATGVFKAM
jgi:hypothetical protein